jgi:hypothetical protein
MNSLHQEESSADAVSSLERAASLLAACARPALSVGAESTPAQLSSALTELVMTAELFGCKPAFWRWAAQAAALLDRSADAETYRKRGGGEL